MSIEVSAGASATHLVRKAAVFAAAGMALALAAPLLHYMRAWDVTSSWRVDHYMANSKLVAERGGVPLMPELGYQPVNRYLPPRPRRVGEAEAVAVDVAEPASTGTPLLQRWLDRVLSR